MNPTVDNSKYWYVMRDLKRPNALRPAYKELEDAGLEIFTPMRRILKTRNGRRVRESVPIIRDLLFVRESRSVLDPIVERMPTLQYRYRRGGEYREPMVVADSDMEVFIRAVESSRDPKYYLPSELTAAMYGRTVKVVGGVLDGYEGRLLSIRGARTKRLLVELPDFVTVAIEADFDYVQLT